MRIKAKCLLFDLNQSLGCGQVFRWRYEEDQWWYGVIGVNFIKIRQVGNILDYETFPKVANSALFIKNYFRLDDDLETIYSHIGKDEYLQEAIRHARGLRLIRQDPWECMISFIISQQNQIPKIQRSLETISEKFGTKIDIDEGSYYIFPTAQQLSNASIDELKVGFKKGGCALGYRAKYVLSSALLISNNSLGFSLDDLREMPYEMASKTLQDSFCGIGPKVADCILLFSMDKLQAFPLDTWIRKIFMKLYFGEKKNKKITDKQIRGFSTSYFGKFAGYAQEYLYCHRTVILSNLDNALEINSTPDKIIKS